MIRTERLDPTRPAVAEEIRALMVAAYTVEAGWLGVTDFPPLRRSAAHVAAAAAEFLGVRERGVLVAAAELEDPEPGHAHIGSLVVHPSCFRRGFGAALVRAACAARAGARVTVSTGERNAPAVSLYERLGFAIVHRWATSDGIPMVTLAREP